jgi:hypothetical protein
MGYLGRNPSVGSQKILDSLESQFDGLETTFDLRYGTNPIYPTLSSSLIVSLGGVLQEPNEAYYVSSDTIVFSQAPQAGLECWILLYSEYGASQTSAHSQLSGLANDDHTQYLHTTTTRSGVAADIYTTGHVSAAIMSNPQAITVDQSIPTNYNANSWGPITVNTGVTVTVGSGSYWTVR